MLCSGVISLLVLGRMEVVAGTNIAVVVLHGARRHFLAPWTGYLRVVVLILTCIIG